VGPLAELLEEGDPFGVGLAADVLVRDERRIVQPWPLLGGSRIFSPTVNLRPPQQVSSRNGAIVDLGLPDDLIQVEESGGSGEPPVLLLHGLGCSSLWWRQVTALLGERRQVLAPDLPRHGGSPPPPDGAGVEEQADALAAVLRARAAQPATVVGHSLGGLLAVALAERHPALVDRVVLISTLPDLSVARMGPLMRLSVAPGIGPLLWRLGGRRGRRHGARSYFAPGFEPSPDLLQEFESMAYHDLVSSSRIGVRFWRQGRVDARIPASIPATALFGAQDGTLDPDAAATLWSERQRGAVLPGVGHSAHVERPEAIAEAILAAPPARAG
jgi:pimeloyl-ACP methyl ester carboxylesterase